MLRLLFKLLVSSIGFRVPQPNAHVICPPDVCESIPYNPVEVRG